MKSTQLQTELDALVCRRGELAQQLDVQHASVETARRGLVTGFSSASDLSTAQGEESAFSAALDELDGQIGVTRACLSSVLEEEEEERKLARARELAQEAQGAFDDHEAAFREACEYLMPRLERMVADRKCILALRNEMKMLGVSLPFAETGALNTDWSRYKFDYSSPAVAWGIESGFLATWNQAEKRPAPTFPRDIERPTFVAQGDKMTPALAIGGNE